MMDMLYRLIASVFLVFAAASFPGASAEPKKYSVSTQKITYVATCSYSNDDIPTNEQCISTQQWCADQCMASYMEAAVRCSLLPGALAAICHAENTWALSGCLDQCRSL